MRKDANAEGILNYLYKNTDLQVNYNFNMVAIDNQRPKQVSLRDILLAYVNHRQDVVTRRSQFELKRAQRRQHIVEGLMKALSILDQVIATIRQSKDKKDAKLNLMAAYQFTEQQAEAIVSLQLYRLTNTDITALQKEAKELAEEIEILTNVLSDSHALNRVIKKELREIKKQYATPRLTKIEKEIEEIVVETEVLVAQEDVVVSVTREGYWKRSSTRSYSASAAEEIGMKESDYVVYAAQHHTLEQLLFVTSKGNMLYRPVHELPELRWKDVGEHISQSLTGITSDEEIIAVFPYEEKMAEETFVFISRNGMIKQTKIKEFAPWRTYKTRPTMCMNLKEADEIVNVYQVQEPIGLDVFLVSHRGFGLRYALEEVNTVGPRAAGVISMNLKEDDYIINGLLVYSEGDTPITLVTQRGAVKRMLAQEISPLSRAKRGIMVIRELKKNPHRLVYLKESESDDEMILLTQKELSIQLSR